jgi:hypothetical protein
VKTRFDRVVRCIGPILVCGLTAQVVLARGEQHGSAQALFVASDFPRLARGVSPGIDGEATVSVWAPSEEDWRVEASDGTLTLRLRTRPGDPTPRWQALGKVKLAADRQVKVVVAGESSDLEQDSHETSAAKTTSTKEEKSKAAHKDREQSKKAKQPQRPASVPALLWLSAGTGAGNEPEIDMIRGRGHSLEPSPDRRRSSVRTNDEGAEFQAPASAEAWRDRALHLREQMLVSLGLWPMFPKTPLYPKVYGRVERGDYTIEKVVLETFPGFTLSGNLYRPVSKGGKLPGLMCPHGHWQDGRMNPEVQQRCIRWAKLGCVVLMYDMVGYNDSKPFPHEFLNDRLRRWGMSLATLQTWNSIRALDWLTSLPDVDPARIGCTGESGGGTQTFVLTALDARIKVSAPVVMVSDSFQGGCLCENAAGLRLGTDNVEFAALCAPRPLFLIGATGDWTAKTMERAYPAIRGVYALVGSRDRVGARVFDFPHNYNQTSRNAVYSFMSYWLLGLEDAARTKEGDQHPEKAEDLATFDAKHPAPSDRKSPDQLESYLIASLRHEIGELSPSVSPARWEASRRLLATALRTRVGQAAPAPESIVHEEVRRITREGLTVVHSLIGRKSAGDAIPVVRLSPGHAAGRLTIVAHPSGKAALATESGHALALAKELLSRGHDLLGFDPIFVGESLDSRCPIARRPETDHFETYNPTLAADQIQDLATVITWAREQTNVREVNLVALDIAGPQVLLARPVLEGLARTVIALETLPDPESSGSYLPPLDLPGMFQFGGFKAAAALTAPAPLWLYGAPASFDSSWPRTAYALRGSDHTLRVDTKAPSAEKIANWVDRGE